MSRRAPLSAEEYVGLRLGVAASYVGFVISGFLVLNHLRVADASFCTAGEWASCNSVNRSAYSVLFGVPVALVGQLGFLSMAALATARLKEPRRGIGRSAPPLMSAAAVAGLGFGTYLTFVEAVVLQIVCLLCVASLVTFVLAVVAMRRSLVFGRGSGPRRGRRSIPAEGG